MNILTISIGEQITNGIAAGITASIILVLFLFVISLAVFALYVAVAKKNLEERPCDIFLPK